mgnify:FL=1|jgi:hypothetical protein
MPEETFYIKQNDTASFLTRDLKDAFGAPVNVTAAAVVFSMRVKPAGTVKVDEQGCTIVTAGIGRVRYEWTAANTNTADEYEGEFQVTYANGKIQTFPNDGYIPIVITDDIEG